MEGIVVETEFRHQRLKELREDEEVEPHKRKEDLRSDYVNSGIFNDLESYRILEEVNNNALNSMPLDIMGLMDVPEINDEWFQLEQGSKGMAIDDSSSKSLLSAEVMFNKNYKRYFCPIELLNGYQMLNRIGIYKQEDFDTTLGDINQDDETRINRDPQKIVDIFSKVNNQ